MIMAVQWAVLGLLAVTTPIYALRAVEGSPCSSVCGVTTNTTSSEISCLDQDFNTTATGQTFEGCINCLLTSEYQNTTSGETDVNWGLFNLRYAFSSCVYDYPTLVTNVSTPCLVSCTSLGPALTEELTDPAGNSLNTFCSSTSFADNVVSTCETCYGLTSQQAYLANFLESVRYNCHFPTSGGTTFPIDATRIFNSTELPTTTTAYTSTATASGNSVVSNYLTVIIVMPIVGFLIIAGSLALCCFCLIRHRRRLAKKRRQNRGVAAFNTAWQPAWGGYAPSNYHQQSPMTFTSPLQQYMMGSATPFVTAVPGQGFEVVDHNGKRYEAGYSTHYISPVSPEETVPQQPFQFGTDAMHTGMQQQQSGQDMKGQVINQETEIHPQQQEYSGVPHAV